MTEEFFDENGIISDSVKAEIEDKVASIKKADPKLKVVYPIVVEGNEYDEKEIYVGYFKQPSFAAFSKFLTFASKDHVSAMKGLAKDCFIEGDKELVDDDSLFLFGLMGQLNRIIESRNSSLVNLSKPVK